MKGISVALTGVTGDIGSSLYKSWDLPGSKIACIRSGSMSKVEEREIVLGDEELMELNEGNEFQQYRAVIKDVDCFIHCAAILEHGSSKDSTHEAELLLNNSILTGCLVGLQSQINATSHFIYMSSSTVYKLPDTNELSSWIDGFLIFFQREINNFLSGSLNSSMESYFLGKIRHYLKVNPINSEWNIYTLSKFIGELFVYELSNYDVIRLSNIYGPGYRSGRTIQRMIEIRLEIYENLLSNMTKPPRHYVFEDDVYKAVREIIINNDKGGGIILIESERKFYATEIWDQIKRKTIYAYGDLLVKDKPEEAISSVFENLQIQSADRTLTDLPIQQINLSDGLDITIGKYYQNNNTIHLNWDRSIYGYDDGDFRTIKKLRGSSSGYVYLLEDSFGSKFVRKIANRRGVDGNGKSKLSKEYLHLKKLSELISINQLFPKVLNYINKEEIVFLDLEYIPKGLSIADKLYGSNNFKGDKFFELFHNLLKKVINNGYLPHKQVIDTKSSFEALKSNYTQRASLRASRLFDKEINSIVESNIDFYTDSERPDVLIELTKETIIINGQSYKNPLSTLKNIESDSRYIKKYSVKQQTLCIHGDFTFLNTVYDESKDQMRMIDPRGGVDEKGELIKLDPLYDFAKMIFSITGFYNIVDRTYNLEHTKVEGFRIFLKNNLIIANEIEAIVEQFCNFLQNIDAFNELISDDLFWNERLNLATACHYLSDIPFRVGTDNSLSAGIACYLIGTIILNKTIDNTNKDVRSLPIKWFNHDYTSFYSFINNSTNKVSFKEHLDTTKKVFNPLDFKLNGVLFIYFNSNNINKFNSYIKLLKDKCNLIVINSESEKVDYLSIGKIQKKVKINQINEIIKSKKVIAIIDNDKIYNHTNINLFKLIFSIENKNYIKKVNNVYSISSNNLYKYFTNIIKNISSYSLFELLDVTNFFKIRYGNEESIDELITIIKPGDFIAIDGPTASGKTEFTLQIIESLKQKGYKTIYISQDWFLEDRIKRNQLFEDSKSFPLEFCEYENQAWNQDRFLNLIQDLYIHKGLKYDTYVMDDYDRESGCKIEKLKNISIKKGTIVLFEGTCSINHKTHKYFDIKIHLDVNNEKVLLDRIKSRHSPANDSYTNTYLENRFWHIDFLHAQYLRKNYNKYYNFIIDATDLESHKLYYKQKNLHSMMNVDLRQLFMDEMIELIGNVVSRDTSKREAIIQLSNDSYIHVKTGGRTAIDITKIIKKGGEFIRASKSSCIQHYAELYNIDYDNILFFGDKTEINGEDSNIKENKLTKKAVLISVNKNIKPSLQAADIDLSQYEDYLSLTNTEKTEFFIGKLWEYYSENIDINVPRPRTVAAQKMLDSLNCRHRIKTDKEDVVILVFDIDFTLLGSSKVDPGEKERLDYERAALLENLKRLHKAGFKIVISTVNSIDVAFHSVVELIVEKEMLESNPIHIYANGNTSHMVVVDKMNKELDEDFGQEYNFDDDTSSIIKNFLGSITDIGTGEVRADGYVSHFYDYITDFSRFVPNKPTQPNSDGNISRYFPLYSPSILNYSESGNLINLNPELRFANKRLKQFTIAGLPSSEFNSINTDHAVNLNSETRLVIGGILYSLYHKSKSEEAKHISRSDVLDFFDEDLKVIKAISKELVLLEIGNETRQLKLVNNFTLCVLLAYFTESELIKHTIRSRISKISSDFGKKVIGLLISELLTQNDSL